MARKARAKVRKLVAAGVDFIKVIQGTELTPAELQAIVDEAHKAGKTVATHGMDENELRTVLAAGVDSVEHTGLAPGSLPYSDDIVRMLVAKNTFVDPTGMVIWRYKQATDPAEKDRIREQLVPAYESLVYFLARKFQNRGEPLEDIVQVGFLGLIKAIERFDPDLGNEFTTFATPTIAGEIKRYFRDKTWSVSVPRRLKDLNLTISRLLEELTAQLGRSPSVAELAEAAGVDEEEVVKIGRAHV